MAVFKHRHTLPSAAWVDGGNIQIQIKDLPAKARVLEFVFRLEGLFTTGAAAAAVASTQLHRLIQMIDIGPNIRGSGLYFHFLQWAMRGAECALPAGLPAANNEAHRRHITWRIPFYDRRAAFPYDGCPVGADFNAKVISINTNSLVGLDGGANTWNTLASLAGTLRVEAILAPPNDKPSAILDFGFGDLTGQAPLLVGTALYEDLFVYRETAATISSAQIATVQVSGDGAAHIDQTRLSEFTSRFNDQYAIGSDPQAASATVPIGGELLPESPAVTAGAADTVTVPFLPVIFPCWEFKAADLLQVEEALRLDFTGTDTSFRIGYRRRLPHSESSAVQAFRRLGQPVSSIAQVASATGSGRALPGRAAKLGRFLPLQPRR